MRTGEYYYALYEVARTVSSTLRIHQVLNRIVESTARGMQAKACSLRLLTPRRDQLIVSSVFGLSEDYVAKGPIEVSRSQVDADAILGNSVQIHDAGADPRMQYPVEAACEGIRSILIVPVAVKETVIGVLRVYTREPHEFTADELDFLQAVAELSGIAIENARIYEALEAQFDAIRRAKIPWAENFAKPSWR